MMVAAALPVFVMVATGMVLYRRLARFLLAGDAFLLETELLLLGILPGLALVGGVVTYLSIFHLLRLWVLLLLAAAVFVLLRRDACALVSGVRDGACNILAATRRGDLFPLIALGASILVLVLAAVLSQMPSDNVDVWVFHMPLAQSFVIHSGFAYPQILNRHYGSQPLFFELLAGTAMLAAPGYLAADGVNVAILFGFLLLLFSFARRARGFQLLVVFLLFCWAQDFLWDATEPMIDLPRSCFSVAALLFAYRYALNFRHFDLTLSALLAGAAVAGKYTELVTPAIIAVALAPLMLRRRETWVYLVPAAIAFIGVAAVWYLKNWIFNGNPIYPFLFGHPGLTDAWVKDYMLEMTRPFDPADRVYSTNLMTLNGWHDFAVVMWANFDYLLPPVLIILAGLFFPRPRRWMLPLWAVILFLLWYAVMFNALRWAVPAIITTCAAAFISWTWMVDALLARPTIAALAARKSWALAAGIAFLLFWIIGLQRFSAGHGHYILPRWMSRDMAVDLMSPGGVERYLDDDRPGYAMYRYIGQHNLAHVFQPFDDGAAYYVSIYNGGHSNDWLIGYRELPDSMADADQFLRQNDIHYFIQTAHLNPVDTERLGPSNVALAEAIMAKAKPHSKLLFDDRHGLSLYQILPDQSSGGMR